MSETKKRKDKLIVCKYINNLFCIIELLYIFESLERYRKLKLDSYLINKSNKMFFLIKFISYKEMKSI